MHLEGGCLEPDGALDGADHRAAVALTDVDDGKLPGTTCAARGGDVACYVTRKGRYRAAVPEDGQHQQRADVPGHDGPVRRHVGFKAHVGAPQHGHVQGLQGKLRPHWGKKNSNQAIALLFNIIKSLFSHSGIPSHAKRLNVIALNVRMFSHA